MTNLSLIVSDHTSDDFDRMNKLISVVEGKIVTI